MTLRLSHLLMIGVTVVASGLVHGWWTNRWVSASPATARLDLLDIADTVGDWQPGKFLETNPDDTPPGCQTVARRFASVRGGRAAVVAVTCGHPGIVAVHTPDVCYLGSGYKLRSAVRQETIPLGGQAAPATFYVADFQRNSATASETVRVRWAWTAAGPWEAPNYPRWFFARAPILYKLYVVHAVGDDEDLTREDPFRTFVAALVPTLSRQLTR